MKYSVGENTILFRLSRFGRFLQGPVVRMWLFHLHSAVKNRVFFSGFFCRRAPCLRHFIGHSFGTSGKHQPVPMIGISPKTRKGNQLSLIPLGSFSLKCWSGWKDLNLRPLEPHSSALPDCATSRHADGDTFLMPRCQQLFAGSVNFFWLRDALLFVSIFISTD